MTKSTCRFCSLVAATVGAGGFSASGDLLVRATVASGGGSSHYEFEVENTGPQDFSIVSLINGPLADPLIGGSLTAPVDFLASYDSGLGIVDFIEFTGNFAAGTTVGGFSFDSLTGPGLGFNTFEAIDTVGTLPVTTGQVAFTIVGQAMPDSLGTMLPVATLASLCWLGTTRRGSMRLRAA